MKFFDVSFPLRNGMPVYKGNPPFEQKVFREYVKKNAEGREGTQLSVFTTGTHNGTHVDGSVHAGLKKGVEEWPLELFYGDCKVVEVRGLKEIDEKIVGAAGLQAGDRVLFKTDNSFSGDLLKDFAHITLDGAKKLVEKKVALVGIDSLAVQKSGSQTQQVHRTLLSKMPVIEGLRLKHVAAGKYVLCAFPLSLEGDAALMRAVLIKE